MNFENENMATIHGRQVTTVRKDIVIIMQLICTGLKFKVKDYKHYLKFHNISEPRQIRPIFIYE